MATEQEIAASIERSRKKYLKRREKQTKIHEEAKERRVVAAQKRILQWRCAKEGADWAETNTVYTSRMKFNDFEITMAYTLGEKDSLGRIEVPYAFTVKSPSDKDNPNFAKGLAAYRLKKYSQKKAAKMTGKIYIPTSYLALNKRIPFVAIRNLIDMKMICGDPDLPQRLRNAVFQELNDK